MKSAQFEEIAQRLEWIKVPNRLIRDTELTDSAKWIYMILMAHRNRTSGLCFPSQETVAEVTGLSVTQCGRAIQELEQKQYVNVTKNYKPGGTHLNNNYVFTDNLQSNFTRIKTAVVANMFQRKLTHKHVVFYAGLRRFANDNKNYIKNITRVRISELVGISTRTVKAHLEALQKAKIIELTESDIYINCWNVKLIYDIALDKWGGHDND